MIASDDDAARFAHALEVIAVPSVHPQLAFVLSTIAGHLFGYEAALAIDASARPLREARAAIESTVRGSTPKRCSNGWPPGWPHRAQRFFDGLRGRPVRRHLEASTAVQLASLLRYAAGTSPLDSYELEHGKVGTPSTVVRGPHRPRSPRRSRSSPARSTPSSTRPRRSPSGSRAPTRRSCTSPLVREVLRAGAPRDGLELPGPADPRRARPRGRRGHRLHPLPRRGGRRR